MVKKKSIKNWINKHSKDKYVKLSQSEGYRSRAFHKLFEIDNKFKIINSCQNILDLGSAPGSWSEYISKNYDKKNIVAISSIAYPADFFMYVDDNFKLIETYNFPDHHKYRDQDIIKILKNHGENITILTTEKDAVKLCEYKHLLEGISVYYVPINITFLNKVSILEYLPK